MFSLLLTVILTTPRLQIRQLQQSYAQAYTASLAREKTTVGGRGGTVVPSLSGLEGEYSEPDGQDWRTG